MAFNGDEDFGMVLTPPESPIAIQAEHDKTSCPGLFCQLSHTSKKEDLASERAIEPLVEAMQATAAGLETQGPIFHANINPSTDRDFMYHTFVGALPLEHWRVSDCYSCKDFLQQYGDLCIVREDGRLIPLLFPTHPIVPQYYQPAVRAVVDLFSDKMVGKEFRIWREYGRTLGCRTKGDWSHISIRLERIPIFHGSIKSRVTETLYRLLNRALLVNSPEIIARAYHLIHENRLPYANRHKASMTYLLNVSEVLQSYTPKNPIARRNLVTKYACTAVPGCLRSLRNGMLGFLFQCINDNQDFKVLKRNWTIFALFGCTSRDLERVYLMLEQVPQSAILWEPTSESLTTLGRGGLCESKAPETERFFNTAILSPFTNAPSKHISFRHFVEKVTPTASMIEVLPATTVMPYFFTTGKTGTKSVFSFHSQEPKSHTASWYASAGAVSPSNFGWKEEYTRVKAVVTFPHMWDSLPATEIFDDAKTEAFEFKQFGIRALFVLEGAKDSITRGLGLFPEMMKGDFHSVRNTVEAFSYEGILEQPEGNVHVGGLLVKKDTEGGDEDLVVVVRTKAGQVSRYRITSFE